MKGHFELFPQQVCLVVSNAAIYVAQTGGYPDERLGGQERSQVCSSNTDATVVTCSVQSNIKLLSLC